MTFGRRKSFVSNWTFIQKKIVRMEEREEHLF